MKPKRGDVREDGMVFWGVNHRREEWIMHCKFEDRMIKAKKYSDLNYESNKEKLLENNRKRYQLKRVERLEQKRQYALENQHKIRERNRQYAQSNKEKVSEYARQKYQNNKEKISVYAKQYRDINKISLSERKKKYHLENKAKVAQNDKKKRRRKHFTNEDGSSFNAWIKSLRRPQKTFEIIANLQPDPGQTLAELIHELSGYAMEVCELIANPTVIEDSPALTPPPAPDLF